MRTRGRWGGRCSRVRRRRRGVSLKKRSGRLRPSTSRFSRSSTGIFPRRPGCGPDLPAACRARPEDRADAARRKGCPRAGKKRPGPGRRNCPGLSLSGGYRAAGRPAGPAPRIAAPPPAAELSLRRSSVGSGRLPESTGFCRATYSSSSRPCSRAVRRGRRRAVGRRCPAP